MVKLPINPAEWRGVYGFVPATVVNLKYETYDVYIGRPGPFGNPFRLNHENERDQILDRYRAWLNKPHMKWLRDKMRAELRGKVLGCYCKPKACHGDVIVEIVNA